MLSVLSKDLVRVTATVTEHSRTAKVIVFKKKRRKNYKRKKGMCMTQCYNYRLSPRKKVFERKYLEITQHLTTSWRVWLTAIC